MISIASLAGGQGWPIHLIQVVTTTRGCTAQTEFDTTYVDIHALERLNSKGNAYSRAEEHIASTRGNIEIFNGSPSFQASCIINGIPRLSAECHMRFSRRRLVINL